jgi:hypothetical protein
VPVIERVVQPPSSLLLVMDPAVGRIPETMGGELTASTGSCVAIGTRSEADGATRVRLLTSGELAEGEEDTPSVLLAWQGILATPTGELVVASVTGETYASRPVRVSTQLRLLVNDEKEPDEIWIVVVD